VAEEVDSFISKLYKEKKKKKTIIEKNCINTFKQQQRQQKMKWELCAQSEPPEGDSPRQFWLADSEGGACE